MPSASNEEDMVLAVYMPAARTDGRTGVLLDAVEVLLRHLAGAERADRFERR